MSDPKTEQLRLESDSWAEFEGLLSHIPRDRWEEPGVLDGWTLKEMLWHVGGWLRKCAANLEALAAGGEEPESELTVDETNERLAAEARSMAPDAVWVAVVEARELVRRRFQELPEVDERAIQELADETYEHYPEHVPDLRAFG
jgi:hypothetical protein